MGHWIHARYTCWYQQLENSVVIDRRKSRRFGRYVASRVTECSCHQEVSVSISSFESWEGLWGIGFMQGIIVGANSWKIVGLLIGESRDNFELANREKFHIEK